MSYQEECIDLRAEIERGKELLTRYEHERDKANLVRNWMVFFCLLFLVASITFFVNWRDEEKYNRFLEGRIEYYQNELTRLYEFHLETLAEN